MHSTFAVAGVISGVRGMVSPTDLLLELQRRKSLSKHAHKYVAAKTAMKRPETRSASRPGTARTLSTTPMLYRLNEYVNW